MAQRFFTVCRRLQDGSTAYEVVGIYRQSSLWEQFSYAFTPNTIFTPNASLPDHCYSGQTGIYYTIILENGSIEKVSSVITAQGYAEDTLLYYDNGFTEISNTLKSFRESAFRLCIAASLTGLATLTVFLALFVYHQRRSAGLMLSMGAGRRKVKHFIFTISIIPVVISSTIGAIVGALLLRGTLQRVFSSASEITSTDFSSVSASGHAALENTLITLPWVTIVAAISQIMLYALAVIYLRKENIG